MTCRDVRALLDSYLDEELTAEMRDRVDRHLLRCAGCAQECSSLERSVRVLRGALTAPEAGEGFVLRALEILSAELDIATRLPDAPGQLVLGIGAPREP
jgi:anti-sigma factor RsiW